MEEIVRCLKYLYDHYGFKFFVTGSSSFYLKHLFPESLSGRKLIFELFPLDFEEFLLFKGLSSKGGLSFEEKEKARNLTRHEQLKKLLQEYEEYGGFPQIVIEKDLNQKKLIINDIFTSYFEKDVRLLADFRHMRIFRDCLLLLMERTGTKLEISKLASELGVTRETIYSYIAFLQGTYVLFLVPPYSQNRDREVSGAKKIYFCDTGMLNHFSKISAGSLIENAVFLNLRKYGTLAYYQKRSGSEIDFIVNGTTALEIKRTATAKDSKHLETMSSHLGLSSYYLVSREFVSIPHCIMTCDL